MFPLLKKLSFQKTTTTQVRQVVSSSRDLLLTSPKVEGVKEFSKKIEKTTLEGGIQVISVDLPTPTSNISLYVKAGPRYENRQTLHSSIFLKHLAFKGTHDKSAIRLIRDLEHIGASLQSSLSRDFLTYHIQTLRNEKSVTFEIISESLRFLLNPLILEHEVESIRSIVLRENSHLLDNSFFRVSELLHFEGFRDSGLSNPIYPTLNRTKKITPQEIHTFVKNNFYPGNRITIVGTGIEHHFLLEKLKPLFTNISLQGKYRELKNLKPLPIEPEIDQKNEFLGQGALLRVAEPGDTYLGLAFPGVGKNCKNFFAAQVLGTILGGGCVNSFLKFSTQSSVLNEFLEKNSIFKMVRFGNLSYSDAGLFVIYAKAEAGNGKAVLENLVKVLRSDFISKKDVEKAKLILKNNFLVGLSENPLNFSDYLNDFSDLEKNFLNAVDAVSVSDVQGLASQAFSVSPALAAVGDVRGLARV